MVVVVLLRGVDALPLALPFELRVFLVLVPSFLLGVVCDVDFAEALELTTADLFGLFLSDVAK